MLADRFDLHGSVWDFVATLDLNLVGYFIAALFVLTWAAALAFCASRGSKSAGRRTPAAVAAVTSAPRRPPLALRDIEDAAVAVRAAGGRPTSARRTVLEALFAAEGPVSAEQIADGLGGRLPTTDPGSVYRNLEWLEALGVVRHVHLGHGPGLYTLAGDADREYLVCEHCGRVAGIEASALSRARAEIKQAAGYEARFDHFPIHGLCPDCAASGRVHTTGTATPGVQDRLGPASPYRCTPEVA